MKPPIKFALFFALSAIALRLIVFYGGFTTPETPRYTIFLHLLLILLTVFFALQTNRNTKQVEKQRIGADLRTGIQAGGLYTVIVTAFVYVYYKFIDTTFFTVRREEMIAAQIKSGTQDPEAIRQSIESVFTLGNYIAITLLGLMFITMAYTLILVVIKRFILERQKTPEN